MGQASTRIAAGAVIAPGVLVGVLLIVGFGPGGVIAGSLAASLHSGIGTVAAGSAFAICQSIAAGGAAALPALLAAGAGGAAIAALAGTGRKQPPQPQ
ncbi:hypothetical protein NLI96_g384 [Meripilus lineatus]|uniref:Uncharacterized protein n=1 Tax=Meripilus lineatus TaxID=2056292 RepID=A0AAD5VEY6_9APHY|nr:hypothetical protein NLI96_g384 [Physisporinus lineatus]